jgi:hypothetical protein
MLADRAEGKKTNLKKKAKKEEMPSEEDDGAEEDAEMSETPDTGFKYAADQMGKMLEEMEPGEDEAPAFEQVELTVDGKPMSGNALVDFVMENQDQIRAMDKSEKEPESAMLPSDEEGE